MRFVRATKGVSFKDERLAFAPVQGVPCAVFSTIPYYKTVRNVRYVCYLFKVNSTKLCKE